MRLSGPVHLDPGRPAVLSQRPQRGVGRLPGLHERRHRLAGRQHPGHPDRLSRVLRGSAGEQVHAGNGESFIFSSSGQNFFCCYRT